MPVKLTRPERLTPDDAGTWLNGSSTRTADQLNADAWDLAVHYGMTEETADQELIAKFYIAPSPRGVRWADDFDVSEALTEMANQAADWLTEHVAPEGFVFFFSDGLILATWEDSENF